MGVKKREVDENEGRANLLRRSKIRGPVRQNLGTNQTPSSCRRLARCDAMQRRDRQNVTRHITLDRFASSRSLPSWRWEHYGPASARPLPRSGHPQNGDCQPHINPDASLRHPHSSRSSSSPTRTSKQRLRSISTPKWHRRQPTTSPTQPTTAPSSLVSVSSQSPPRTLPASPNSPTTFSPSRLCCANTLLCLCCLQARHLE